MSQNQPPTSVNDPQAGGGGWWRLWRRPSGAPHGSSLVVTETVAILTGLVATLVYSAGSGGPHWDNLSASAMVAAASLASGAFLGLLFGIPRSLGPETRGPAGDGSAVPIIGANTNLEQISDWLTKIIVGVSLTQLGSIKSGAAQLFGAIGPTLGDGEGVAAFAASVVIYFLVVGFLAGWLYARLRLGLRMSAADAYLELSRRADRAGDHATAQAAKDAAVSITQAAAGPSAPATDQPNLSSLVSTYDELRATMESSPRRTGMLEDLVRQARQLSRAGSFTAQDVRTMFSLGTEGRRIMALALMEGDPGIADFPSVLAAVRESKSAFEQFHGLTVANLMVSSLAQAERDQLSAALNDPTVQANWRDDPSRRSLADRILARLATG